MQLEACPTSLGGLPFQVLTQNVQQCDGACIKGERQEQYPLLASLRMSNAKCLHPLHDFGGDIFAKAALAERFISRRDDGFIDLTSFAESGIYGLNASPAWHRGPLGVISMYLVEMKSKYVTEHKAPCLLAAWKAPSNWLCRTVERLKHRQRLPVLRSRLTNGQRELHLRVLSAHKKPVN